MYLSELQFPYLYKGYIIMARNEVKQINNLAQGLAHAKLNINISCQSALAKLLSIYCMPGFERHAYLI